MIKNAIAKIAHEKEWDITPFEEVYKKIIDLNYNNYWTWGKKIKSPNKMYAAKVYLEHEVKNIKIYIIIQNKQGDIVRDKFIVKEPPHEYAYVKHLGKLTWLSNNEVQFINKNNTRQWSVCIEEMNIHKNV